VRGCIAPGTPLRNKTGHHATGGWRSIGSGGLRQHRGWPAHANFRVAHHNLIHEQTQGCRAERWITACSHRYQTERSSKDPRGRMRGPPDSTRGAAGADDGAAGDGGFVPGPEGAGVRAGSTAGARPGAGETGAPENAESAAIDNMRRSSHQRVKTF